MASERWAPSAQLALWLPTFATLATVLILPQAACAQDVLESDNHGDPLYGSEFVEASGRFWFSAIGLTVGAEVWNSDGTAAGTVVGGEIEPGYTNDRPIFFLHVTSGRLSGIRKVVHAN